MGYSNNKWRKILTILMIINLCFILFARFSHVFGAYSAGAYSFPDSASNYRYHYVVKYENNRC